MIGRLACYKVVGLWCTIIQNHKKMKTTIKISVITICLAILSSCAVHSGLMSNSAQLSHANFKYVQKDLCGTSQTTRVLGFGGVFKADMVEKAKKDMLKEYELKANQALANVTVDWKHSRYLLVKFTKCTVSADVVEFVSNDLALSLSLIYLSITYLVSLVGGVFLIFRGFKIVKISERPDLL